MSEVSVLLPCYNAADTLDTALSSLARQTLTDFEIIVVDDGSTDRSPDPAGSLEPARAPAAPLRQPHAGIIPALNTGLAACQAQLIARMDTDDRAHPERLARQLAFLEANRDIAVAGCLVEAFPAGQVREGFQIYLSWLNSLVTDEDIRREIFVESPLVHPSVMFRKDWVIRAGGYQERGWAEDYDLWLRLYLAGARFGKVPESLLDWREHPGRLTRTDGRYALENFLRAKAHYLVQGPLGRARCGLHLGSGHDGPAAEQALAAGGRAAGCFSGHRSPQDRAHPPEPADPGPGRAARLVGSICAPGAAGRVGARGARPLIRARLAQYQLREGADWWSAA